MDKILELLNSLVSDTASSHTFDSVGYKITVSNNPDKIRIFERRTGKVKLIKDLNELEISLLALLSALCDIGGIYGDKES